MTTEHIAEKIRKLLALAANNPSQAESASALAKAQALMTEHKIEQAILDASKPTPQEENIFTMLGKEEGVNRAYWKLDLAATLGRANGVFIYKSGGAIGVVGKKSNIQALSYMFAYCISEVEKLSKLHCKGLGHSYANDFKRGCVSAIGIAIEKEREALERTMRERASALNGERGLIVLNNALTAINADTRLAREAAYSPESGLRLRKGSYGGTRVKTSGYGDGQKAGSSIYPGSSSRIGGSAKRIG